MMWKKEEITDATKLKETVDRIMLECEDVIPGAHLDSLRIVQNILREQTLSNPQFFNPVINYTYYLIFEELFIKPSLVLWLHNDPIRLPLWIIHNGSTSLSSLIVDHGVETFYENLKQNVTDLLNGELGELQTFFEKYQSRPEFLYNEFVPLFFKYVLNPQWEEHLNLLGEEYNVWNKCYSAEDWVTHSVL